jgi:uncharacterized protein (TIGR03083 family)
MARRLTDLVLSAADPERPVPATPGWSVTDVFAHVSLEPSRYRELALGRGSWPARADQLPAFNAEQIRMLPTRDISTLAAMLVADTDALIATIAGFGDNPPIMNFDGDQRVRADIQLGTLLGEFAVHGHDIARTLHRPWRIDPALVPMVLDGVHQALPAWFNRDAHSADTAVLKLSLRGLRTCYVYAFTAEGVTIDPDTKVRVDVHISAEPTTALLMTYGRVNRWSAALTGKVIAWGRRPALALTLPDRFLPA